MEYLPLVALQMVARIRSTEKNISASEKKYSDEITNISCDVVNIIILFVLTFHYWQ